MTARVKELTDRATSRTGSPMTQPAHAVHGFVQAFERLGYDVDDLLAAAGLKRADLADPDALLPCTTIPALWVRSQERRPMRNLALHLALATPLGAYPLLDYLVSSSDTVGDAHHQLARYLGLVGSPIAFAFHEDEDPVRVAFSCPGGVFTVEFTILLSVLHMRRETEGELAASIHFAHRPDDVGEIERLLRSPVQSEDGWDGVAISRASWTRRLRRRDPVLRVLLERQAQAASGRLRTAEDPLSRLRAHLASRLTSGDLRIETAARALAMAPRTLQRRLAEAGTTYQDVLDDIRREAADGYIRESELSAGQIAYLLGYSEPAAFHRAFKRWHRMTPAEYRKRGAPSAGRSRAARTSRRPR